MDTELRKLIRDTFPEFCANSASGDVKPEDFVAPVSSANVTRMDLMVEAGLDFTTSSVNSDNDVNNSNHIGEDEAMFSDEEEEPPTSKTPPPPPTAKVKVEENVVAAPVTEGVEMKAKVNDVNSVEEKVDLSKHLEFLDSDMRNILTEFQKEKDPQQR